MNAPNDVMDFLKTAGWGAAHHIKLPSDFSTRCFTRLERSGATPRYAILMQAKRDQNTAQYVMIAGLLRQMNLSAPEVYAAQSDQGWLLMEDFGDSTFGKMMDAGHEPASLYRCAVKTLVHMHQAFTPVLVQGAGLPEFNAELFTEQAKLFLTSYFPYKNQRAVNNEECESFCAAWMQVLTPLDSLPRTLMLRDFMPDNLMDLSERKEWKNVGLLDFQDGGIGPLAYDLASLCETVRRDSGAAFFEEAIITYHKLHPVMDLKEMRRAFAVLAAQRHTRILGILVKLARNPGQQGKLAYLPRVLSTLQALLRNEVLEPVLQWMEKHLKS